MVDTQLVELADRYSRKRALVAVVAALVFLGVQFIAQPRVFGGGSPGTTIDWWAVNAIVLLAVLATGGGILNRRRVRTLVHDDLSRGHLRTAVLAGYWIAMGLAFVLYLAPWFQEFTARQAIYVIVTGSIVVSLLTFAGLERRAHADA
jgi:protein-S-isoprenylcysteine O-methyltransferase Ste14